MSALRVTAPRRVRALAILLVVLGISAFEASGAHGLAAWLGFILLAGGLSMLDGLAEGRLGLRQVALVLVMVGTAAVLWSALVIALLGMLTLAVPLFVYAVLVASLPVAIGATWLLLRDRLGRPAAGLHAVPHRGGSSRAA